MATKKHEKAQKVDIETSRGKEIRLPFLSSFRAFLCFFVAIHGRFGGNCGASINAMRPPVEQPWK